MPTQIIEILKKKKSVDNYLKNKNYKSKKNWNENNFKYFEIL